MLQHHYFFSYLYLIFVTQQSQEAGSAEISAPLISHIVNDELYLTYTSVKYYNFLIGVWHRYIIMVPHSFPYM